jgi:large subunit ribosomal protein L10
MRPEKANIVSDLSEKLNRSPFLLVTDYQRMKVDQFGELRNRLAPAGAEMRVVKNSFLKRAMADSGLPDVGDKLVGQTAIVMGEKDVAPVAKILKTFAAEFKIATLKIGVVDKSLLSSAEVEALAELPSREVLLAQLLGLFLAPATRLVRVLNEPASAFARILKERPVQPNPLLRHPKQRRKRRRKRKLRSLKRRAKRLLNLQLRLKRPAQKRQLERQQRRPPHSNNFVSPVDGEANNRKQIVRSGGCRI